jgi:hypothetical protein
LNEVRALISLRLENLYDSLDATFHEHEPAYPFHERQIQRLANMRTRDVLGWCREYREACILAGRLIEDIETPPAAETGRRAGEDAGARIVEVEQEWNAFRNAFSASVPEEDEKLVDLLAWSIEQAGAELDTGGQFKATPDGRMMEVEVQRADSHLQRLLVGLCNKNAKGPWLTMQIQEVADRAGEHTPVIVRCTDFPQNPRTKVNQQIGRLIAEKHARRVVVEDSQWRTMLAFREFQTAAVRNGRDFMAWRRAERPLSQLKALQRILGLDEPPTPAANISAPQQRTTPKRRSSAIDVPALPAAAITDQSAPHPVSGPLHVGTERSLAAPEVSLPVEELTKHAAFLGSSGSGKTTVALNLIEQLLLRGIPAVLVDRKGDLCRYASEEWWSEVPADPNRLAEKQQLRQRLDVRLYTPGHADGRPLSLSVVPPNLEELSPHDRLQVIGYCASALAAMMRYGQSQKHQARLAILRKAIETLAELRGGELSLEQLIEIVADQDPALVSAVGRLDPKQFDGLVQDLETLRLTRSTLLAADAEQLSAHTLFGSAEKMGLAPDRSYDTAHQTTTERVPVPFFQRSEATRSGKEKVGLAPDASCDPARQPATARVPVPLFDGKTRLTIISTKFLTDQATAEFWVARLLVEIARWTSKHPSDALQAVLMFDEADIYLPAQRKPATKEPMENLLKRARSAGLGVFLSTQNPGDFDYKFRENIGTWFVGQIKENNSITKMQPMLADCRIDIASQLPRQTPGQFYLLRSGHPTPIQSPRSLMGPQQLPETEILTLSRQSTSS